MVLASLSRALGNLAGWGEAELVPQARLSGPMPWVIAIMVALAIIGAIGYVSWKNRKAK